MNGVVVGFDLYLKRIQGAVMEVNGEMVRQEKFSTDREGRRRFLEGFPLGSRVALDVLLGVAGNISRNFHLFYRA